MNKQEIKKARDKYNWQRSMARKRKIEFHFSFDEWLQFWLDSGYWYNRGRKTGQYVMCRYGDIGPYSIDNVFIELNSENVKQARTGKPNPMSDITKQKLSKINKERLTPNGMLGKKQSDETKRKISLSQKIRLAKKLQEVI